MKTEIRKKSPPTPPRYVPQPGDWFTCSGLKPMLAVGPDENSKHAFLPHVEVETGLFTYWLIPINVICTKLNLVAIENGVMIFEES